MFTAMPKQQRGVTFGGLIGGAFVLVVLSIFGLKLVPAYMEDAKVKNIFTAIAHDPDMQKGTLQEVRASFERRSSIDNIKAIKAADIEITTNQGRLVLSASYYVMIPLGGNVSLYLAFNPTSVQ